MIGPGITASAKRNLVVLAAGMAALYGMIELAFGAATLSFEETGGSSGLVGFAPALFLVCAGLAALPAGRAMDTKGPRPTLLAGFSLGLAGSLLAALAISASSLPVLLLAFGLTGAAAGTVLLSRAAAAAMVPPEVRPRAISLVLFGAVFGALLGPLVFSPLLDGDAGGSALDLAWLGAAGFMLAGLVVVTRLVPAQGDQGEPSVSDGSGEADQGTPLREAAARPGVPAALFAVLASWAGMVTTMALVGSALVDHGHAHGAVFPVVSAHFVGMFAFFAIVGRVIDRIGRTAAIASGLVFLALSALALIWAIESIHLAALVMLGIGLGWSLSFVAATAELSERAVPGERATLIGLSDLMGDMTSAALVIAGGFTLDAIGVATVCIGAAVLPLAAALWIVRNSARGGGLTGSAQPPYPAPGPPPRQSSI